MTNFFSHFKTISPAKDYRTIIWGNQKENPIFYCPQCFSNNIEFQAHGVAEFIVNDKKRDASKFIFDLKNKDKSQREVTLKCREFFEWYSGFNNKDKIKKVELLTSDYSCSSGCKLPLNLKFNLMELEFFRSLTIKLVEKECAKHKLAIFWAKDDPES